MSDKYKKRKYEMWFLNGDFIIKGKKAIQNLPGLMWNSNGERTNIFAFIYLYTL